MLRIIPGCLLLLHFLSPEMTAQVRSLDFYLEKGASNSPYVKDVMNQAKILSLENDKLKAGYNKPTIYGTSNIMKAPVFNGIGYDVAMSDGAHYSALANINQPLFTGKYLLTEKEKNEREADRSLFSGQLSLRELKKQITDQYIICFYDQEHLNFLSGFLNLISDQYNASIKLAQVGILKTSDLILLEIEIGNNRNKFGELNNKLREDFSSLNILSGIFDTTLVKFEKPFLQIHLTNPTGFNFLTQFRLDSLLTVSKRKVFDLKYEPQISAFADAGLVSTQLQNIEKRIGFSAGLNFSMTIFDGKQRRINEDQSKISLMTIENYKENFKNEQNQNLGKLRTELHIIEDQILRAEEQLGKFKLLQEIYRKELERGDLSVTDYLMMVRTFQQTQDEYLNYQMQKLLFINAYNFWNW